MQSAGWKSRWIEVPTLVVQPIETLVDGGVTPCEKIHTNGPPPEVQSLPESRDTGLEMTECSEVHRCALNVLLRCIAKQLPFVKRRFGSTDEGECGHYTVRCNMGVEYSPKNEFGEPFSSIRKVVGETRGVTGRELRKLLRNESVECVVTQWHRSARLTSRTHLRPPNIGTSGRRVQRGVTLTSSRLEFLPNQ